MIARILIIVTAILETGMLPYTRAGGMAAQSSGPSGVEQTGALHTPWNIEYCRISNPVEHGTLWNIGLGEKHGTEYLFVIGRGLTALRPRGG